MCVRCIHKYTCVHSIGVMAYAFVKMKGMSRYSNTALQSSISFALHFCPLPSSFRKSTSSYENQNPLFCIIRSFRTNVNCKYLDVPYRYRTNRYSHSLLGYLSPSSRSRSLHTFHVFIVRCILFCIAFVTRSSFLHHRHTIHSVIHSFVRSFFQPFTHPLHPLHPFSQSYTVFVFVRTAGLPHLLCSKCHKADDRK